MKQGFIQFLVIIALLIVIMSLLGVNIASLLNNKTLRDNFSFIGGWIQYIWLQYLQTPASYLWEFFKEFIWEPSLDSLRRLREGGAVPNPY